MEINAYYIYCNGTRHHLFVHTANGLEFHFEHDAAAFSFVTEPVGVLFNIYIYISRDIYQVPYIPHVVYLQHFKIYTPVPRAHNCHVLRINNDRRVEVAHFRHFVF